MKREGYFESEKFDCYFKLLLTFFTITGMNIYLWLKLIQTFSFSKATEHPFISIILIGVNLFFGWVLYIFIKEHSFYKANFVATPEKIAYKGLIYRKEIEWKDVDKIYIDIYAPITYYLAFYKTKCIVLELQNGQKHKIISGNSYKNIDEFKRFLHNNFSKKIID